MGKRLHGETVRRLKILAGGDIHGSEVIAEHLAEKAEKNKVDLVVLAGDISSPFKKESVVGHFKKRNLEVLFVPGNWDSTLDVSFIRNIYGIKNLDGYSLKRKDVEFLGLGNQDFRLDHSREKDFDKLEKLFKKTKSNKTKRVLVSHLHVAGSKAEFSGFGGSYVLRKAIEEFEPDMIISSHIHEAEGIEEMIKNTRVIQVGSKGKIIYI